MTEEENSLLEFKNQLSLVESSLEENPSNSDLLDLKRDLIQLIQLTESKLVEEKKKELLQTLNTVVEDQASSASPSWEGRKCQAPFRLNGNDISYHNAVVFAENGSFVTVVFSNPCTNAMKPCDYYMSGNCKFEERCKFSHGETVSKDELKDFKEPDFSLLSVHVPVSVLAKSPESDIWEHAKTLEFPSSNSVLLEFLKGNDRVRSLPLESVFPLEVLDEDDSTIEFAPTDLLDRIQGSTSALGEWEKYTRGIGSKLMTKMGYIFGSGLGKEAQGIVDPIPCVIFPAGKSLDFCMEQRDKVKKLDTKLKDKKKDASQEKTPKQTVFDFLNNRLHQGSGKSTSSQPQPSQKSKSETDLKIENFQLAEEILKCETELDKLDKSRLRYIKTDPNTARTIQSKVDSKRNHLARLKSQQRCIQKEQCNRSDRKKLSIF